MNYTDLNSGDIVLFKPRNWISHLINYIIGTKYFHTGIIWCYADRIFLLEAVPIKGVILSPLNNKRNFPLFLLQTSKHYNWTEETSKIALDEMGKHYSYFDAFRAIKKRRFKFKGVICSEYVANIMNSFGESLENGPLPDDILNYLKQKYDLDIIQIDK